jgi:acyl dehydratase
MGLDRIDEMIDSVSMINPTKTAPSTARMDAIRRFYHERPPTSDWFHVTQDAITQFCDATGDTDWIHRDAERARRDGPYGSIIAPGFWTLSMLAHLSRRSRDDFPAGAILGINYGFDRVRFPGPVRVGSRIRLKFKLTEVTPRDVGTYLIRSESIVEVEGQEKPALVADWMFLLVYRD